MQIAESKEREGERECEHGDRTGRVCAGDMEIIPSSRESEFDNERESSQAGENEGTGKEGEELGLCPNHPNTGFNNWKKALEKCSVHKDSQCHKLAVMTRIQEPEPVNVLKDGSNSEKKSDEDCWGVRYLARQGLDFRGDQKESGNLSQLLKYKATGDAELTSWLKGPLDFTSPELQNELLKLMANTIIKEIVSEITSMPVVQFAIIIDGTQDISGVEQESICALSTTKGRIPGQNIAKVACDVMTRLQLPLSQLRGQTFKERTTAGCVLSLWSPLRELNYAGCLWSLSTKYRKIRAWFNFHLIEASLSHQVDCTYPAIRSVLKQYESVLMALEEMASCSSPETSAKANGLHGTFLKGNTVLGLLMAEDLMGDLECLNTSLQLRKQTVSGMLEAVDHVKTSMQDKRTEEHFDVLFSKATAVATKLDLQPIQMPHVRKPTKRYTGQAAAHIHPDAQSLYRVQFYNALDTVNTQFIERFEQAGFHKLQQLENVLLHGDMDKVVEEYPELNSRLLQVQLAMFGANYTYETSSDVASIIREMVPEVRGLFGQVEALVRLLLVVPASSAEVERSFSALRRLKTWLRSSMSQTRLNNVAICHVHQKKLDRLDLEGICQSFISANDKRKKAFGPPVTQTPQVLPSSLPLLLLPLRPPLETFPKPFLPPHPIPQPSPLSPFNSALTP
ncbi:hypothetical protein F7725_003908, partial [Dissostichus mawsoni]